MNGYFDANATTPLCSEARAALIEAMDHHWQNPSSPYRSAAQVHVRLEQARSNLAGLFQVNPDSVIFNSGATEGNFSVFSYWRGLVARDAKIAVSSIEHPSVLENARQLFGESLVEMPVDESGRVALSAIEDAVAAGATFISLMAANNETGVLQPWHDALEICRQKQIALHVDASQWVGREPLVGLAEADFVTACAHKFGGPKGAGFVLVRNVFSSFAGQRGGSQENDHRAGTENFPAIAAMVTALQTREAQREATNQSWLRGREQFLKTIRAGIPELVFWGDNAPRLANTVSLCLPKGENSRWVRLLDQRGFDVSTGSACATGQAGPSHVLAAMAVSPEQARQTIRVSALATTLESDWQALGEALVAVWQTINEPPTQSQVIEV
ncbi:MAG: cysteine desulfurase family protein [Verrucomicrobiota bacterium]